MKSRHRDHRRPKAYRRTRDPVSHRQPLGVVGKFAPLTTSQQTEKTAATAKGTVAGRPLLDAKYKRRTSDARPYGDLYQMLAYCTALGLPTVHLVYADGDQSRNYVLHRAGTRIHAWIVGLT
jgi:McrBC 5-methylcytosine restriction system component